MKCVIFKIDGTVRQLRTHMRNAIKCAEAFAHHDETIVLTFTDTGKFSDKAIWDDGDAWHLGQWVREEA